MWWVVCALVGVVTVCGASDQLYHHDSYGGENPLDSNADEAPASTSSRLPTTLTSTQRYVFGARTLYPQEVDDVQGALKELFAGRNVDFEPNKSLKHVPERTKRRHVTRSKFFHIVFNVTDSQQARTELTPTRSSLTSSSGDKHQDWFRQRAFLREEATTIVDMPTITTGDDTTSADAGDTTSGNASDTTSANSSDTTSANSNDTTSAAAFNTTTASVTETVETTPVPTTTATSPKFDIDSFLAIVANLTYDYDTNLTEQLNETLQRFSIPTCATPTTITTTTPTQTTTEMWYNTAVVAKCFVCGMDTPGIPQDAYCADAFATDFLPLLPVDARAKGHIARFRKYCRYFDVNNFQHNRSDPRAMLGRWTGGCAVRWIDLSGVYTQRTCRNRLRPATGRHYGSKRMAKLEHTLSNVDDGCIISPMATLVPLSRGVSLYARFHACVCSGNWCNRAEVAKQWTMCLLLLLFVVVEVLM